jgi:hypothetical protein
VYYLGCDAMCENKDISSKVLNTVLQSHPETVDQNLKAVSGSVGLHGYIISAKCAKVVLETPIHTHIDLQLYKWIDEFNLSAFSVSPVIVTVNERGDSNMSETYPKLLNSIIHPIQVFGTRPLDWVLSENLIQIGWHAFSYLLILLAACMMFLPYRVCLWILGWVLLEGIYAMDAKSTSKFVQVLGGILLVRWGIGELRR